MPGADSQRAESQRAESQRVDSPEARTAFASGRIHGATLVCAPALLDALSSRLTAHGTLYAWAEAQAQPRALQGRAVVYIAELPECATTVVVRHAWHGGMFAPLTGDRFLVPTRAPREAAASAMLHSLGVPTPEFLGYALYPAGPGLRRVDILSRYVPDAWDFGAVLRGAAPHITREQATAAVLVLLRTLASAHAVHPDLNVKNILLVSEQSQWTAWVLDVDVVRFRDMPPAGVMARNVRRLSRSIRKWHSRHELTLDEAWLGALEASAMQHTSS